MVFRKWPGALLGKAVSKGSLLAAGGFVASKMMAHRRKRWEEASQGNIDAVLEQITSYDIARGAGKLLKGWLCWNQPELTPKAASRQLDELLAVMDPQDPDVYSKAMNRLLVSKVLFYLEGFHLSKGLYEAYQQAARDLLGQNPKWRKLSRQDIFQGRPFEPEELIGATHRMLLVLGDERLPKFIADTLESGSLQDDSDYMARLIAGTLNADEAAAFEAGIIEWFEAYRDFKIAQTHQQESWMQTGISTVSGGLPLTIGQGLLSSLIRSWGDKQKPEAADE